MVTDYVSFTDVAPTFVEAAGLKWKQTGMKPTPGRSLFDIMRSQKSGRVNPQRDHVLIGKERHDIGRPKDAGYPIRGIVAEGKLFIRNFKTERWPGGNPETGYLNCDGSPTKTLVLQSRRDKKTRRFWELCFGKRVDRELYDIKSDPDCITNMAETNSDLAKRLEKRMIAALKKQGDPRMFGKGDVFDNYPYANKGQRNFYERYMRGEKIRAGWVRPTDFEKWPGKSKP